MFVLIQWVDDTDPRFACLGLINLSLPKKRWVSTVLVLDYLTFRLFLGLSTNCSIEAKPALLSLWINLNQLLGIVGQVFVDDNSFYTICEPVWYKLACGYMWIFVIIFFFQSCCWQQCHHLDCCTLLCTTFQYESFSGLSRYIYMCVYCTCVCMWVCVQWNRDQILLSRPFIFFSFFSCSCERINWIHQSFNGEVSNICLLVQSLSKIQYG